MTAWDSTNSGATSGMGLISMRERAELVHGNLELLPAEGGGDWCGLTVPLAAQEAHV